MGNYLDKDGLTRFKEKMLTEVDKRIATGGGGSTSGDSPTKEELIEATSRVTDVEVNPEVATLERLQTAVATVESNLNNKMEGSTVHVTETWSSGTSWYRKYSDGWVEQGGVAKGINGTITLFVTMANTNYSIVANVKNSTDGTSAFTFQPRTPTTTAIPYYCTYVHPNHSGGSGEQYCWEVKGYSA